jgi:hypothetical protein
VKFIFIRNAVVSTAYLGVCHAGGTPAFLLKLVFRSSQEERRYLKSKIKDSKDIAIESFQLDLNQNVLSVPNVPSVPSVP